MGAGNEVDAEAQNFWRAPKVAEMVEIGRCRLPRNATPETRHSTQTQQKGTTAACSFAPRRCRRSNRGAARRSSGQGSVGTGRLAARVRRGDIPHIHISRTL